MRSLARSLARSLTPCVPARYFNNAYYAKVGGVPCAEVNSLELEFLFSINFALHATTELYERELSERKAGGVARVGRQTDGRPSGPTGPLSRLTRSRGAPF